MTTTSYLMLTAGILIGFVVGTCLWELLVAGPEHRRHQKREFRLMDRANMWHEIAALERLDKITDNNNHSKRVPDLRAVK